MSTQIENSLTNPSSIKVTVSYFQSDLGGFIDLWRSVTSTKGTKADPWYFATVVELCVLSSASYIFSLFIVSSNLNSGTLDTHFVVVEAGGKKNGSFMLARFIASLVAQLFIVLVRLESFICVFPNLGTIWARALQVQFFLGFAETALLTTSSSDLTCHYV